MKGDETSPLRKIAMGSVVAYFKYQATKLVNEMNGTPGRRMFQRSYYDHIIRDDLGHFFVVQYIELNPIMWELNSDNPKAESMTIETLKRRLQEEHGLKEMGLENVLDRVLAYREWTNRNDP